MVIAVFLVVIMVRIMIDMLLATMRDILVLNHYRLPPAGLQLELAKFILTLVIVTPIIGVMSSASRL